MVVFPARQYAAEFIQPCKQALYLPPALVAANDIAIEFPESALPDKVPLGLHVDYWINVDASSRLHVE
jgi:hypothetical protein